MRAIEWLKILILAQELYCVFPDGIQATYTKYCDGSNYTASEAQQECKKKGKHLARIRTDSDLYHAATTNCSGTKYHEKRNYSIGMKCNTSQRPFFLFNNESSTPVYTAHKIESFQGDKLCAYLIIEDYCSIEKIKCEKCNEHRENCFICSNNLTETTPEPPPGQECTKCCDDISKNQSVPAIPSRTWSTHKKFHPTASPNRTSRFRTKSSKLITGGIHFTTTPLSGSSSSQSITPLPPTTGQEETIFRSSLRSGVTTQSWDWLLFLLLILYSF